MVGTMRSRTGRSGVVMGVRRTATLLLVQCAVVIASLSGRQATLVAAAGVPRAFAVQRREVLADSTSAGDDAQSFRAVLPPPETETVVAAGDDSHLLAAQLIPGSWNSASCLASFTTGESFNLKSAGHPQGHYVTYSDGFTYMFQVCGNMRFSAQDDAPKCGFSASTGSDCPESCSGAICGDGCGAIQISNSTSSYFNYCYTAGQVIDTKTKQSDVRVSLVKDQMGNTAGVRYTTTNGDSDYCDTGSREMNVEIHCPTALFPASLTPTEVTSEKDKECSFTTKISHASGCAGASAGGSSSYASFCSYLLIASLVGAVGYVGGFAAYNYKYLDLRGMEMLPHRDFWAEQPGQMKDGALWTWEKITQAVSWARGKINGYRQIN